MDETPAREARAATARRAGRLACIAGTAVAAAGAAVRFGPTVSLAVVLVMLLWLGAVALIDVQTNRIPNRLTYPALLLLPLYVALVPEPTLAAHLLGGLFAGGSFALAFLIRPGGIGLGDVKLALVIGLYLGLEAAAVALLVAALLGGVLALLALALGASRRSGVPYAPVLAAGAAVALLGFPLPGG
jgi:leader peptidase (prepilin peptidase)/N-methyltransferase